MVVLGPFLDKMTSSQFHLGWLSLKDDVTKTIWQKIRKVKHKTPYFTPIMTIVIYAVCHKLFIIWDFCFISTFKKKKRRKNVLFFWSECNYVANYRARARKIRGHIGSLRLRLQCTETNFFRFLQFSLDRLDNLVFWIKHVRNMPNEKVFGMKQKWFYAWFSLLLENLFPVVFNV